MTRFSRFSYGAALLTALAGIALVLLQRGYIRFNYPSASRFPMRGVDVSHHQGAIDWARVRGDGFSFAYIKASEGADHRDSRFAQNWAGAGDAGLHRGAYHFFTFCTPGREQAENLIAAVDPRQAMLPPAVDVEYDGNCAEPPPPGSLRTELAAFLDRTRAAYGRPLIVYATHAAYREILAGHFIEQPIWIRDILREPLLEDRRDWLFWQYADRGRVAGIDSLADLDVFRGSAEALAACAAGERCL